MFEVSQVFLIFLQKAKGDFFLGAFACCRSIKSGPLIYGHFYALNFLTYVQGYALIFGTILSRHKTTDLEKRKFDI